ncbi:MAG: PAS domain-containing protein [Methanoregula sp.]|jgi:hypothetical protein|nr:PAS domain-containing protein [Methanoregula sp.]MDD5187957.1 PAS domain-containing protein [Methanoregula sp.]
MIRTCCKELPACAQRETRGNPTDTGYYTGLTTRKTTSIVGVIMIPHRTHIRKKRLEKQSTPVQYRDLPLPVISVRTRTGTIVSSNAAGRSISGYSEKDLTGAPIHILFPAHRAENAAFLRFLNRPGVSRHHHMPEAVLVTCTGRCRHTRLLIDYFRNTEEPFRCARIYILVDPSTRKERGLVQYPEKGPDSLTAITCKGIHDRIFSLRCNRELMDVEMSRVNSPRFTTLLSRMDDDLDTIASLVDRLSSMNDDRNPHTT